MVQFLDAPRAKIIGAAILIVLAIIVYWPVLSGEFILDDDLLLTQSPVAHAPNGLHRIWFTAEPIDYWPVTNTSFWLEWRLWGDRSTGYHCTNLALHIIDSLLVWLVLVKLEIPGAYLAAILFAVHPVNVESVAWIAQRKNLLAMLFSLVAVLWWLKSEARGISDGKRAAERQGAKQISFYWLSLVAFVLAGLSKGSAAVLPIVLLLIVWWRRGRLESKDFIRAMPFFALGAVLVAVNIWFQHHGSGSVLRQADFLQRLLGAGAVVWFYLAKAVAPVNLLFIYPQWEISATNWLWWLPLAATMGVTAMLWHYRRTEVGRALLVGWLFFCIALLPVMGFVDVGYMQYSLVANHYEHVALIGVMALVAAGWSIWERQLVRSVSNILNMGAVAVVGALAVLTWQESNLYASAAGLYGATLASNSSCWLAANMLGRAEAERGQSEQAIQHYRQALEIRPSYADAHYNLAVELTDKALRWGDDRSLTEALKHYAEAVRVGPDSADLRSNYARALDLSGQSSDSLTQLEVGYRIDPSNLVNDMFLSSAYMHQERWREAIAVADHALEVANGNGDFQMVRRIEDQLQELHKAADHAPASGS